MSKNGQKSKKRQIIPMLMNEVALVQIHPEDVTLAIEAASEMKKDFVFINNMVFLMAQDTRQEITEDEDGNFITRTIHNPHMLEWFRLKRQYTLDLWKMTGGEAITEAQKEKVRLFGKILYDRYKNNPERIKEDEEIWKQQFSKEST